MVGMVGRGRRWRRWPLMVCGATALMAVLQGCATTASAPAADANAGLVTPSDEPETRRRARISL